MNTEIKSNPINDNKSTDDKEVLSILFIMDESGSMSVMGDEPLQGINNFYKKQNESGEFMSTLCLFNTAVKFVHKNINGKDIPMLSKDDYKPNGMTALYDAIGESVNFQLEQSPTNVLAVILTDGEENSSQKYKKSDIKILLNKMEKENGWKIMYLGANQDSFKVANGIGVCSSANYTHTPEGCSGLFRRLSTEVSRCVSQDVPIEKFKFDLPQNIKPDDGIPINPETHDDDFEILPSGPPSLQRTYSA